METNKTLFHRVETIEVEGHNLTTRDAERAFLAGEFKMEVLSVDYYHYREWVQYPNASIRGSFTLRELDLVIIYWSDGPGMEQMKVVHGMRSASIKALLEACSENTGADPSEIQIHKIVL